MALTDRVIRLREVNGVIYASSRTVAEDFKKDHKNVVRDIKLLREEIGSNLSQSWFRDDQYFDAYNRPQDCIDMSRQGWELVVMNYRGMIDWKVAYILKFEEMEAKLGPGARTAALFDQNNPVFRGPPKAQGQLSLVSDDANQPHPDFWIDRLDGIPYRVSRTHNRQGAISGLYIIGPERGREIELPVCGASDGQPQIYVRISRNVPFTVVERNFRHLPQGKYSPIALATLRHHLAL